MTAVDEAYRLRMSLIDELTAAGTVRDSAIEAAFRVFLGTRSCPPYRWMRSIAMRRL
jgi:hypothetical protein